MVTNHEHMNLVTGHFEDHVKGELLQIETAAVRINKMEVRRLLLDLLFRLLKLGKETISSGIGTRVVMVQDLPHIAASSWMVD
jgi:hypothetical protein